MQTSTPTPLAAVLDERAAVRAEMRHTPDPTAYAALLGELDRLNREAARLIAAGRDA